MDVDDRAAGTIEPKVRTSEPAFPALLAAVQAGRVVTFDYRRPNEALAQLRTVEPWGVVAWRGRWYLVGHDRDRRAPRCFRLSRVQGDPKAQGRAGAVSRPPDVDLLSMVAGEQRDTPPSTPVRLWVVPGRAQGLRRQASVVDSMRLDGIEGDVLELDLSYPDFAASWIAGYGPDVVVLEPDVLRKSVHEAHLGAAAAAAAGSDEAGEVRR